MVLRIMKYSSKTINVKLILILRKTKQSYPMNVKLNIYFIKILIAIDLLKKMLESDPHKRFSAADALNHPWIMCCGKKT